MDSYPLDDFDLIVDLENYDEDEDQCADFHPDEDED